MDPTIAALTVLGVISGVSLARFPASSPIPFPVSSFLEHSGLSDTRRSTPRPNTNRTISYRSESYMCLFADCFILIVGSGDADRRFTKAVLHAPGPRKSRPMIPITTSTIRSRKTATTSLITEPLSDVSDFIGGQVLALYENKVFSWFQQ